MSLDHENEAINQGLFDQPTLFGDQELLTTEVEQPVAETIPTAHTAASETLYTPSVAPEVGATAQKRGKLIAAGATVVALTASAIGFALTRGGEDAPAANQVPAMETTPNNESESLSAPVIANSTPETPVTTTAPETTIAAPEEVLAERQPGIIQPIDIEGLTADLTSEIDQEAFETMLASASETITYGYNSDSIEHLMLTTSHPASIDTVTKVLEWVNEVKATQISHFRYGYRMEAVGPYRVDADGSIIADVEEFSNDKGALRSNQWQSLGVYTMRFRQIETSVQMPDGSTQLVPVWKFVSTLAQ